MGSKNDSVSFRIDNGPWKKMVYTEEHDPKFWHDVQEWDYTEVQMPGRRPSNAIQSTHLWRAGIPTNLEPGEHIIEVRAIDMFGRTITGKGSYRIELKK